MTILWEFDKKHPKEDSAYGTASWVISSRPSGTEFCGGAVFASESDFEQQTYF
jgi:hypothetical protein